MKHVNNYYAIRHSPSCLIHKYLFYFFFFADSYLERNKRKPTIFFTHECYWTVSATLESILLFTLDVLNAKCKSISYNGCLEFRQFICVIKFMDDAETNKEFLCGILQNLLLLIFATMLKNQDVKSVFLFCKADYIK